VHQIGISLGDPAGIGPEVVVRALAARPQLDAVVFGDRGVLDRAARATGVPALMADRIVGVTSYASGEITPGKPDDRSGQAQLAYLNAATDAALAGQIAALVTAPISKAWIARAGFTFPGHTEYLAARAGVVDYAMMLAGPRLRVTVATTHIALRDVALTLTVEQIARAAILTATALHDAFGLPHPRVAVAGMNPHAGEEGRFGDEESRLVVPALALARDKLRARGFSVDLTGPHVPDAVFRQAAMGTFDAVVALYHDQGLIPVKLLGIDDGVNATLGLPFVRTSVDHGTAFDLAGTGRASAASLRYAINSAIDFVLARRKP
jgi:4-hydroxythreonine-4-phosphate dehydrogenase